MEPTEESEKPQLTYASADVEAPDARPLIRPVLPYVVFVVCAGVTAASSVGAFHSVDSDFWGGVLIVSGLASIVLPILLQIERLMNTKG